MKAKTNLAKNSSVLRLCHPEQIDALTRRQLLMTGVSLLGAMSVGQLFGTRAVAQSFQLQRRLVWINMNGGWDIIEITDPKVSSTSGIDMPYSWGLTHQITGGRPDERLGRWLPQIASLGDELLVVRGLTMGTTSHQAGSVYMDTGVLSNTGNVNAASIPAIVASESQATIPIIQLSGGSDPKTDRGLLNPVSVVRAQNLGLYRSMYPQSPDELEQKMMILNHLRQSLQRVEARVGSNDRLLQVATAEEKIRIQFQDDVGAKLALTDEDKLPFTSNAPATVNNGQIETFALALKLLKNNMVSCLNLGIGGFDTHSNQERNMQPIVNNFDFLLSTFVRELKDAGHLDSTLIVVYSDFGRTPKINSSNGRDHWPVGSVLMLGGGLQGGRMVGGTDDNLLALRVNENSGDIDSNGIQLNPTHVAGSVLELTLGSAYLAYRSYLSSIPALVRLKNS